MKLSLSMFDDILKVFFQDERIAVIVVFFLVFYGPLSGPKLPTFVKALFESPVFRVFILSLIVYKGNKNPTLSVLVAVGFILVMDTLNKQKLFEKFTEINSVVENFEDDSLFKSNNIGDSKYRKISNDEDTEKFSATENEYIEIEQDKKDELKNSFTTFCGIESYQADEILQMAQDKMNSSGTPVLNDEEIKPLVGEDIDTTCIITKLETLPTLSDAKETQSMFTEEPTVPDEVEEVEEEVFFDPGSGTDIPEVEEPMDMENFNNIEPFVSNIEEFESL